MKKIEYKLITTSMQALTIETLNALGSESWELVLTQQIGMTMNYMFKREKRNGK